MTSEKQLTVLMPVYNTRKEWLDEAVKSILDQTYKNFSFLIIDDGSIKETADYLDTLATKDKRITVLHNEANQGLVYTLNRGLAFATTPWIARMDADDWAFPDRLSKQMEYLNKHSGITVLGTDAIYLETGRPTRKIQPLSHTQIEACLPFYDCFVHPSVILRREDILKIGGYPNSLYAEDYALWIKILFKTDYKMEILPNTLMKYRRGESRPTYRRIQTKSTFELLEKIAKYLNTEVPYYWNHSQEKDFRLSNEQALDSIKTLSYIASILNIKFPDIDKDFLDLSLLREKKKIYRSATCSGIQDFIKNLNVQVSYLALCLKIKLSRQMSSRE